MQTQFTAVYSAQVNTVYICLQCTGEHSVHICTVFSEHSAQQDVRPIAGEQLKAATRHSQRGKQRSHTLYTVHFILDNMHCTLYIVHCTFFYCIVHCPLHILHCTLKNAHFIHYTVQCTIYTVP